MRREKDEGGGEDERELGGFGENLTPEIGFLNLIFT